MASPRIELIAGTPIGAPNTEARITDMVECQKYVDVALDHGVKTFDTANGYSKGTAELWLGQLDLRNAAVDTKSSPYAPKAHSAENLRAAALKSLADLGMQHINVYYLHAPDRTVPFEETCGAINELYKDGLIKEFGLSNFNSWEVAEIYYLYKMNGWLLPSVYEGRYNAVDRVAETELLPCLRKFGIRFYAFSPLAGGLLSGNILSVEDFDKRPGTRWDPKITGFAGFLRNSAVPLLPIIRHLVEELAKHDLSLTEAATRWLQHHSALDPERGDKILVGASLAQQLKTNLRLNALGPLPPLAVELINAAGEKCKGLNPHYAW
ncbi:NADP-dependent oxidoreductase domain-containing protein [Schizophyllum fasciatum]